jgi:hypothetical protein
MFEKFSKTSKNVELKKSKSSEDFQLQKNLIAKNYFHESKVTLAYMSTNKDNITIDKIKVLSFNDKMSNVYIDIKKGEEISNLIQNNKVAKIDIIDYTIAQKSFDIARHTYLRGLKHYCFYDIISENEETVTIIFLPISTSDNKVSCGIHKFEGDKNARKVIFETIQKDLDENHYSLLKDGDLIELNVEFFSKELPLVKFKFTDLEL